MCQILSVQDLIRSAKLASLQEDARTIADGRRPQGKGGGDSDAKTAGRVRVRSRFKTLKPVLARQALATRIQKDAETMMAEEGIDTELSTGDVVAGQVQDEAVAQAFNNAGNLTELASQGLTGAGVQGARNLAVTGASQVRNAGNLVEAQAGALLGRLF
eukprot:SAG22_NODE_2366_length_2654_cov_2.044227_3_plen_159_part_00